MATRLRRGAVAATAAFSFLGGGAAAFTEPNVKVTLKPNRVAAGSTLHVIAAGGSASSRESFPESATMLIQRGFRIDPRAVKGRCSTADANAVACPASSRFASGTAALRASGVLFPGGPLTFRAKVEAFLSPPPPGSLLGVVVTATEPRTGLRAVLHGRVRKLADGPNGYEFRLADTDGAAPPQIPGVTIGLQRFEAVIGARRTITVRKPGEARKRVRVSLINNPSRCSRRGWRATVSIRQRGKDISREVRAACTTA